MFEDALREEICHVHLLLSAGYQDEDSVLEVSEQRRLSAYSAPFIGIAQQGAAGPGQMQMHHISLQSLVPSQLPK
jgi:hypothetical protein